MRALRFARGEPGARSGWGAAVSAAAEGRPGSEWSAYSGPGSHDVARVASSADGIVSCRLCAWYGLLCACRWVSTACALGEVALLLLVCGAVPLWAVANLT